MNAHERISRDPAVMLGKPCIKGTRITVELILEYLGEGLSPEDIVAAHRHLTVEDVRAAAAFAAHYLSHEGLVAAE
jgi:uncharacterized protein (DUF433 family)